MKKNYILKRSRKKGESLTDAVIREMKEETGLGQRYELFKSTKGKKNIVLYEKLEYRIFDEKQITNELRFVYLEKV